MCDDEKSGASQDDFVPETDLTQTVRVACDFVRDALDDLEQAAEVLDVRVEDSEKIRRAAEESDLEAGQVARQLLLVVARRLEGTAEKLEVTAETLSDTADALRRSCE